MKKLILNRMPEGTHICDGEGGLTVAGKPSGVLATFLLWWQ